MPLIIFDHASLKDSINAYKSHSAFLLYID